MEEFDFLDYITKNGIKSGNDLKSAHHMDFVLWIKRRTQFLDEIPKLTSLGVRLHCLEAGLKNIPQCANPECHASVHTLSFDKNSDLIFKRRFAKFCCYKCAASTNETKEKRRATLQTRYGVAHNSNISDFQNKRKNTMISRYGVDNWMKSSNNMEEWKKNFEKIYGVRHPKMVQEFKDKCSKTNRMNHGGVHFTQTHLPRESIKILNDKESLEALYHEQEFIKSVANLLTYTPSSVQRAMNNLGIPVNPSHKSSIGELRLGEFVESLGFSVVHSDRSVLAPYESDILVPEKNLIIEYNGVYWHSEKHKTKKYHQDKSLLAHNNNHQLIHVWEDDWEDDRRREIIKNKIRSKLGLLPGRTFARKTTVKTPTKDEVRHLMNDNHIQGFVGYSVAYGLYEGESLVACLTLRKTRTPGVYDLNRFASSKSVVGGMSKLIAHVKRNLDFEEIYTYAHLDYSKGDVYEKSGFERQHVTPPGLWYVKKGTNERLRRERFMKHKLPDMFENVDLTKTERQIMNENGYYRIYDAGSIKYRMRK